MGWRSPPQCHAHQDRQRDIIYAWVDKRTLPPTARQRRIATQTSAHPHAELNESCSMVPRMQARDEARARTAGYNAAGSVNAARKARIGPACALQARLRRLPLNLHLQDDAGVPRCPPCLPRARNELVRLTGAGRLRWALRTRGQAALACRASGRIWWVIWGGRGIIYPVQQLQGSSVVALRPGCP